uniref:Annexin n=1 Tax=Oryza brachyantha TaxID=4533 RepID=J3MWZ0_ORYBR
MAMCDAKTLYEAVESGRGVDRRSILQLLRHRSGDQLRAVLASYRRLYGQELARALKRKADGVGHRSGESFPGVFRAALRCAQRPERHRRGEGGISAGRRDARRCRRAPRQPGVRGQDRVDAGERRQERVRRRECGRRLDRRLARGVAQAGLRTISI